MHAKHPFFQTGGFPKTTLSLYCKTAGFAKMARFTSRCRRAVKDKLQFPRFIAPPRSGTRQRTRAVLLWHPLARCWYPCALPFLSASSSPSPAASVPPRANRCEQDLRIRHRSKRSAARLWWFDRMERVVYQPRTVRRSGRI